MTEYIIEWSGIGGQLARLLNGNVPLILWPKKIREERQREEIVRCRDCRYYGCYDGSTWCRRTYEQVPGGICDYQTVEPDGFCAWGERKDDGHSENTAR